MKQNQKKMNKGITLVALVITIILLLILAGISIAQLTGSGLFENARLAEQKSKEAQEKEDKILADYENSILNYSNRNNTSPKGIMTAILNGTYTTVSNPEIIKFNEVYSSIGDTFELSNGQIIIKKDIKHVKVSIQIHCQNGYDQSEFPSIILMKNNSEIVSGGTRFAIAAGECLSIEDVLIEVNKNDIIQVNFIANSTNREIWGTTNPFRTYITIEEL